MNFLKKIHELVGQNEQIVKKSHKHDANLQKNTTLYFQIGLILTLLVTYGLFEMQFQKPQITIGCPTISPEEEVFVNYIPEPIAKPVEVKKVKPVRSKLLAINLVPVKDDIAIKDELVDIITQPEPPTNLNQGKTEVYKPIEPTDKIFDMKGVEQVPIYPGCEAMTTNNERRKCMSQKIGKLIGRKFDSEIASDLGLSGKQRINVQFKIDITGLVTEIKASALHIRLEKEAIKVVNKIPQMIPGRQRKTNVAVIYSLPIVLQVH